ncbi:LCP family glycopolymer transferase [Fundicoccus sp. Sow4_F4]|uniref:LCP family glycopolymer transferase n=1 Tax=Fundicoccus sp. Sow4_F4 TaxID=3438783 RepID=UPI003F8DC012
MSNVNENMRTRSSRNRRRKPKRRHKRRIGCFGVIVIILLIAIAVAGFYAFSIYRNVEETTEVLYTERPAEQVAVREEVIDIKNEAQPFSVLLLGIDTGDMGRVDAGRSDVMMVATVNPTTNRTTITSIPRDSLTNIAGYGTEDKINHAYAFGGVAMSVNTVQELLGIPIDFTVSVNMQGFADIVDSVGGITIAPTDTFSQDSYQFYEGQATYMDGKMALAYSRNRYDTGGDYGRQARQRQLIDGILHAALNISTLWNYNDILASLQGNVQTDVTFEDMITIFNGYRGAINTIENFQLSGSGSMINGVYYEILDPSSLQNISAQLKNELEINH